MSKARSIDVFLAVFDFRIEAGVKAVAAAVVEEAKRNARVKTGFMRRMIRSRISGKYQRIVTAHAYYSTFVENGRNAVYAKPGGVLRFVINGQVFFRKWVRPALPRPFMEPASRTVQRDAHTIFERALT